MQEKTDPWQRESSDSSLAEPQEDNNTQPPEPFFNRFWHHLRQFGLEDPAMRIATIVTTVLLIVLVVWMMDTFHLRSAQRLQAAARMAELDNQPAATATLPPPEFHAGGGSDWGIPREADLHTILPQRMARFEVTQYTVESGDSIFSIAGKFNLQPETILWGNRDTLSDDPHFLRPGQVLNILPVDGVYHRWSAGEGLNGVALTYGVEPEDIINWPGNDMNLNQIGDFANPNIEEDTMLVIPGGRSAFTDWRTPRISRGQPATARHLGPGACTAAYDGVMGTLSFLWPTTERWLSGYDYSPATNHFGIDIAGRMGNPIFAADHGVVVYAGWNDFGYGEMVVIDHGHGWQTLYAHLSVVNVVCGQEVWQGNVIGSMGSTGQSTGPHLHFEMRSDDYGRVNPWDFLN